ncbi:BFH_collapsed_G0021070.mRNA.1.CDS.1 [Saccharomyces cerevisiae]|nr:BFH_collapsed_G0021070.mRNA.1.CDS.1 [Saccharomyces cerevisiae]
MQKLGKSSCLLISYKTKNRNRYCIHPGSNGKIDAQLVSDHSMALGASLPLKTIAARDNAILERSD